MTLASKKVMITGGTRGLGGAMAVAAAQMGAEVWALGRDPDDLAAMARQSAHIHPMQQDVTADDAAVRAFDTVLPDILILNAGAVPHMAPVHMQTWDAFSGNWQTDTKSSFTFGTAALTRPMAPGGLVVTISSGAALAGSFASGGYAGAKRMQWFLSNYLQREADELDLGLRFLTILPLQQFRETEIGQAASSGYADRLGISQDAFLDRYTNPLTPAGFAAHAMAVITDPQYSDCQSFGINGAGIERLDKAT
ncbi:SDR family oxidoreductase [uncultured Tateyamaria sp.]|uniref:SDR family NAD(P)-dependent oxidoreductase n=1 Tax=Tateyamaria sp. 1078 TaxID=3417464 RepID=UPI00262292C7|nr:SDR family oxidoreductase [uncultured Tateyamaria sp.]